MQERRGVLDTFPESPWDRISGVIFRSYVGLRLSPVKVPPRLQRSGLERVRFDMNITLAPKPKSTWSVGHASFLGINHCTVLLYRDDGPSTHRKLFILNLLIFCRGIYINRNERVWASYHPEEPLERSGRRLLSEYVSS